MSQEHSLRERFERLEDQDIVMVLKGRAGTFPDYAIGWADTERALRRIDTITYAKGCALMPEEEPAKTRTTAWGFYALIGIYSSWYGLTADSLPVAFRCLLLAVSMLSFWAMKKVAEGSAREFWIFVSFLIPIMIELAFPALFEQLAEILEPFLDAFYYVGLLAGYGFHEWLQWRQRQQQEANLEAFLDERVPVETGKLGDVAPDVALA